MATARHLAIAAELLRNAGVPSDRLPYTPEFEELYDRFCTAAGREVDRHTMWLTFVDARKRGLVGGLRRRRHTPKD
ncbi:MAG: hypothetical protein P4L84_32760 [Isosphaeraceae bacterium]|nr:hypothetical protein [Isosphaeraceae bacterium]